MGYSMSKKNLRKLLQNKVEFNPFNDNFNYEKLMTKLVDANDYDISIASNTPVFNMYFKEMYKELEALVTSYGISSEVLMKYFIGLANSDYFSLKKASVEQVKHELYLENLSSMRVPSSDVHIGDMNIIASLETIVDILNVIINYLRFFKHKEVNGSIQETEILKDVLRTYRFSNIYYNIKNAYDTALWEDGYIEKKPEKLYIKYIDKKYSINTRVGTFRQQKNILGFLLNLENMLSNSGTKLLSPAKYAMLKKSFMAKRKPVALKSTTVNYKGIISYILSTDKRDVKVNEYLKKGQASIVAYYPYLNDLKLPKLNNLTIIDLLVLLSQLNELISGIEEVNLEKVTLKQLAFKMKEIDLVKYFLKTTFYSEMDIKTFLSLITSDGNSETRLNLWKTPLIRYRNIYYVCIPSIIAPNFLYLIDEWLEEGGYGAELEERGKIFESFVKETASTHLVQKNLPFNIPKKDKFYNEKNEYEEIDFIISLEDLLIVAELKNIKYPMEPRDYHNSLKRLREGAEQAKRKSEFIIHNQKCFTKDLGDVSKKRILPLVITNFSIFSGLKVNDVPVIDLMLLESYIGSGEFTRLKVEVLESKNEMTKLETIKYYDNNNEFILNFVEFMNSPLPIQDLKNKVYVEDKVITLGTAKPQIYLEITDFKN